MLDALMVHEFRPVGRRVLDLRTGVCRPATKEDHLGAVGRLGLPPFIHPLVRRAYLRSTRVLGAAWQDPELAELAELEALRALEFYLGARRATALREMGEGDRGGRTPALGTLLSHATEWGWIRDDRQLRRARFARFNGLDFLEAIGGDWPPDEVTARLLRWLREHRNRLAHGSQEGTGGGYAVLRVVRRLICQISASPLVPSDTPREGE